MGAREGLAKGNLPGAQARQALLEPLRQLELRGVRLHAGHVAEIQGLAAWRHLLIGPARKGGQAQDDIPAPEEYPGALSGELGIPEDELLRLGRPLPNTPQQVVSLSQHPLIALEGAQVAAVRLGGQDVQEAPSPGRGPGYQRDVLGGEGDDADGAHGGGCEPGNAIDADALSQGAAGASAVGVGRG